MTERYPWPTEPFWCGLEWLTPERGYIYYDFPLPDGSTQRYCLPVAQTRALADAQSQPRDTGHGPVWHLHDNGDGTGWTEPSILLPDLFHSPYHTNWRIDRLTGPTWEPPEE